MLKFWQTHCKRILMHLCKHLPKILRVWSARRTFTSPWWRRSTPRMSMPSRSSDPSPAPAADHARSELGSHPARTSSLILTLSSSVPKAINVQCIHLFKHDMEKWNKLNEQHACFLLVQQLCQRFFECLCLQFQTGMTDYSTVGRLVAYASYRVFRGNFCNRRFR